MNREMLKELGLEGEAIDKIMAEYGKEISKLKGQLEAKDESLEGLQEQIKVANEQIEEFKDMDIEEIKKSADEYKTKYEDFKKEAEEKLNQLTFNHTLENKLKDANVRNIKAVKALLDIESIELTDKGLKGLDEQLKTLQESDSYLFLEGDKQGLPRVLGGTSGGNLSITKEEFNSMGYLERVQLKQKDEGLYKRLSEK